MKKTFLTCSLLLCIAGVLFSQGNTKTVSSTFDTWWSNINKYGLSDRWYLTSEVHLRRTQGLEHWRQFLLRPAVNFALQDEIHLTAGYSYIRSYPFRKGSTHHVIENNVWEEFTLKGKIKEVSHKHRYRLEQRFIQVPESTQDGEVIYDQVRKQRFRYRLTLSAPLFSLERFSVSFFDEIWVNLSNSIAPQSLDKNWLYLGLNYEFTDWGKLGVGYMNHWAPKSQNFFEKANILQTTLFLNIGK